MEDPPRPVDDARTVPREQLERDQRGAAARGALVLEPALQELELLPVAELPDRPVRHRPDPVVAVTRGAFDFVVPLAPQVRDRAFVSRFGELLRPGCRLGQIQRGDATG